ncbi:MAG: FtsX-like permease family protein [Pirellulaceae bacterium]|nr:FtsX-like permease family protein [Pirellulaceae bacterium]
MKLTRHTRKFPDTSIGESFEDETKTDNQPQTIFDYYQITSDQLIIDNLSQETLFQELAQPDLDLKPKRILSYLVNEITKLNTLRESKPSVTYSIASGLESWEYTVGSGHGRDVMWDQRPSSCGVNSWLAERLNVQPGDTIRIKFFKPETMEGREIETSFDLLISAVVPTTAPSKGYVRNRPAIFKQAPTLANDPDLTPIVPGITDQDSISNWDLPFKLTRDIPEEDDDYWRDYRLTPKLFMRFSQAERLFGSRFGNVTSIRVDAADAAAAGLDEEKLRDRAASAMLHAKAGLGLQLMPIRALQLQAASGTTPFDGLFLALSFFVIVAALMLVALLFRLSIEQRANQWGLLLATGFEVGRVRSLLLRESFVVVLLGILLGIGLGLGYARLMIAGLESWWVGAVSGSFLSFHITARSLILGALIGGGASLATILWSLRRLKRSTPLDLLRGRWDTARAAGDTNSKVALAIAGFLAFGAVGLLALGFTQNGMAQAGSFFGCGMCLLASALAATVHLLRARSTTFPAGRTPYRAGLWSMAWSALTRNMWRSVLTIGLLAVASFLIASMSLFQIAPTLQGSGGFELIAESSLPIYRDLGSTRVREETLSAKDFDALRTVSVLAFRQRLGEDASCNNLFKVGQPTVLGVPDSLSQHQSGLPESQRFQWAAAEPAYETPWQALGQVAAGTETDPIPVVLDMNTAAWSLHQGASLNAISKIQFDDRVIYFRTVGLLSNSIMQGKLLVSDYNFSRLFPEISGYQFFLVHDEEKSAQTISAAMENGWSDQGMDVTSAEETLTKLLAVQNTYISAFQAIGALGLLLGTVGLAVVQVRSVLERRRELALMQAVGFSRPRLARLLLTEASLLLVGGIAIGIIAATIAILPYMLTGNSNVSIVEPLIMLAIILAVGGLASLIAVVTALRQPILSNLH